MKIILILKNKYDPVNMVRSVALEFESIYL